MIYDELAEIAEEEFFDVVLHSQIIAGKLRLHIVDGSDEEIKESELGEDPKEILRAFLQQIVRAKIHH